MLCQDISPPPAGLNTTFMPSTAVETTRDHFVNSHSVGICYTCHKLMDWIGFSFENYDGWGRYRNHRQHAAGGRHGHHLQRPGGRRTT